MLKTHDWFHSDGFPIAVERREPQEPFGAHIHEFSELVIITGGRGMHVTGRESWPLAAGDVFVIGGRRTHEYRGLNRLCLVNILYQPERLVLDMDDLAALPGYHALFTLEPAWRRRHRFNSRLHLSHEELGFVLGLVDELDEELKSRSAGFGFMAKASFMRIIGYLSRCYGKSRNPDSRALLRIAEAITFLETSFTESVRLDDLAGKVHMSKRSFMRAFHAATGCSPISYLIRLRILRAASMLRDGNETITEIAFAAGFDDSNYFTRQFTRLMGMCPRNYRKQHSKTVLNAVNQ